MKAQYMVYLMVCLTNLMLYNVLLKPTDLSERSKGVQVDKEVLEAAETMLLLEDPATGRHTKH